MAKKKQNMTPEQIRKVRKIKADLDKIGVNMEILTELALLAEYNPDQYCLAQEGKPAWPVSPLLLRMCKRKKKIKSVLEKLNIYNILLIKKYPDKFSFMGKSLQGHLLSCDIVKETNLSTRMACGLAILGFVEQIIGLSSDTKVAFKFDEKYDLPETNFVSHEEAMAISNKKPHLNAGVLAVPEFSLGYTEKYGSPEINTDSRLRPSGFSIIDEVPFDSPRDRWTPTIMLGPELGALGNPATQLNAVNETPDLGYRNIDPNNLEASGLPPETIESIRDLLERIGKGEFEDTDHLKSHNNEI